MKDIVNSRYILISASDLVDISVLSSIGLEFSRSSAVEASFTKTMLNRWIPLNLSRMLRLKSSKVLRTL